MSTISLSATLAGALIGTVVLTTVLRAATAVKLTRMDLPFLLGTMVTERRGRAKAIGYLAHFVNGEVFALAYYLMFATTGHAGWWFGTLLGLLHGVFSSTALVNILLPVIHPRMGDPDTSAPDVALLEAPGFLMLNYGWATPVVTVLAHMAYGAIVGEFAVLAA